MLKTRAYLGRLLLPTFIRALRRTLQKGFFRRQLFDSTQDPYLAVTTVDGSSFIVSSRDQIIGRGMFETKVAWDIDLLVKAMQIVPNSSRLKALIDVGANIGSVSIGAVNSGLFKKAYAFEPDPDNFRILCANVALNDLKDKVRAIHLALTDELGQDLTLELSPINLGDHRIRNDSPNSQRPEDLFDEGARSTTKVQSSTLDTELATLLDEGQELPALLFMDTQGWEGHILKGGEEFLNRNSKHGGALIIEFWPYGLNRAGGMQRYQQSLLSAGYRAVVDLSDTSNHLRLDAETLETLALRYSQNSQATDLLVY